MSHQLTCMSAELATIAGVGHLDVVPEGVMHVALPKAKSPFRLWDARAVPGEKQTLAFRVNAS